MAADEPLHERIRYLAESYRYDPNPALIDDLDELADEVEAADADRPTASVPPAAPRSPLCATNPRPRATQGLAACDRPAGHRGPHSWETFRWRALAREAEEDRTRETERHRHALASETQRANKAEAQAREMAENWIPPWRREARRLQAQIRASGPRHKTTRDT